MRLVTRGTVDGLVCAVLLKKIGLVDEVVQAHPKDMQEGAVPITEDDIICNLPFVEGCGMWFDHHLSEENPRRLPERFNGRYGISPSAARLVYEHYVTEHPELEAFEELLDAVDRYDSAALTLDDVQRPEPAMLLAIILDPRSGLGYHHAYTISNRELTRGMPDLLLEHAVEDILEMPDVKQRVQRYFKLQEYAARLLAARSRVDGPVVITDLRGVPEVPPANRFLVYTLPGHEETTVSIRLAEVKGGKTISVQVAHNIFNRRSRLNVGDLMAEFGGGGHLGAGTCQVSPEKVDEVVATIVDEVRQIDGSA